MTELKWLQAGRNLKFDQQTVPLDLIMDNFRKLCGHSITCRIPLQVA